MEEKKLSDPSLQHNFSYHVAQWFWQSNPDPWKDKDETKWTWDPFSFDECCLLDNAVLTNQQTVDIGNYEIDLVKNLQINKADRHRIRRIKREENMQFQSRFLIELPKPTFINKTKKTMNDAFGNVQHFLNYIMKRTPEAYGLFHRLKELSLDSKKKEYEDLVQEVISSIYKGAEARYNVTGTRSKLPISDFNKEAERICQEIKAKDGPDTTLREFLMIILRIYTMESYICYWLNELLRCENWEEINVLTPYLVCLTYAFQVEDYIIKYEKPKGFLETVFDIVNLRKLILYRGTALRDEHLKYYDSTKTKFFSWNSVTSTSRSREQGIKFVELAVNKKKYSQEMHIGVLFVIEVDFCSPRDCEGMIDVSQASVHQHEQEVILAPGTVFELTGVEYKPVERMYEIRLNLKKKFADNQKEVFLLGALQKNVILKEKAILDGLSYKDIIKSLQLLEGNQLVTKLEIKNCYIDPHMIDLIENTRKTTQIKKEDVICKDNYIATESINSLCYCFSSKNLSDICRDNDVVFLKDKNPKPKEWKIKELCLGKEAIERLYNKGQLTNLCKSLQDENEIITVDLIFKKLLVNEKYMIAYIDFLKKLTALKSLSLNFHACSDFSNLVLCHLGGALQSFSSLQSLSLNFSSCSLITYEGLDCLKEGLKTCTGLLHLSLNFDYCRSITNEFSKYLKSVLSPLENLQHLSLSFKHCPKISDRGLKNLQEAFSSLCNLKSLALDFSHYENPLEEGLDNFKKTLEDLTSLQRLSLNFSGWGAVSDRTITIASETLKLLTSLQYLSLSFVNSPKITNKEFNDLCRSLKSLGLLQELSLDFSNCKAISEEAINNLKESLGTLSSLQNLTLKLDNWQSLSYMINDNEMPKIPISVQQFSLRPDRWLPPFKSFFGSLASLQHLSIDFTDCNKISNKELLNFNDSLKSLFSLQHLSINFGLWGNLNGELDAFFESLESLVNLQEICLDFDFTTQVSIKKFCKLNDTVKFLKSLRNFSLNFRNSDLVSDKDIKSLKDALKPSLGLPGHRDPKILLQIS